MSVKYINSIAHFRYRDGSSAVMSYEIRHASSSPSSSSSSLVSVNKYGQLSSGSQSGVASLVVTSREENGANQSVVIAVKVQPTLCTV